MSLEYSIIPSPKAEEIVHIQTKLKEYSESLIGSYAAEKFAILAKDEESEFVGGLSGWIQWGWVYIDWLYVAAESRRTGVGTKLLQKAEHRARESGISRVRLETAGFQNALKFYQSQGYAVAGKTDIKLPDGSNDTNYMLSKFFS